MKTLAAILPIADDHFRCLKDADVPFRLIERRKSLVGVIAEVQAISGTPSNPICAGPFYWVKVPGYQKRINFCIHDLAMD